jgi:hypothetical protein
MKKKPQHIQEANLLKGSHNSAHFHQILSRSLGLTVLLSGSGGTGETRMNGSRAFWASRCPTGAGVGPLLQMNKVLSHLISQQ